MGIPQLSATLARLTSPEVAASRPLLLVPLGSCEQHGPHLPLDTDTVIARYLAEAAAAVPGALVTPAVAIGASGEHDGFAGTLSIGTDVLRNVLIELVRSADWARGVVFVNGHGGNHQAVRSAVTRSSADGRRACSWMPRIPAGDAHAGDTETSMMLAIDPGAVRLDRLEAGETRPLVEIIDTLRASGVRAVSDNGVLGDPRQATAHEGRALLDFMVADLVAETQDRRRQWAAT